MNRKSVKAYAATLALQPPIGEDEDFAIVNIHVADNKNNSQGIINPK